MTAHKTIYAALAAAQAEMGKALKQSDNPHFRSKYADLGNVMDACMPALNKNGIAVVQPMESSEFGHIVRTVFYHEGGDKLECPVPLILGKNDMQGLGSAITYARRYGLMSLAGIAPEDDDGNAAAANAPKRNAASEAIRDAWRDGVLDSLPEGATADQKAAAFAEAITEEFRSKRSEKTLNGTWEKREKFIKSFQANYPDLFASVSAAYDERRNELAEQQTETIAAE